MFTALLAPNALATSAASSGIAAAHWAGPWTGGFSWLFLIVPLFWIAFIVLLFTFVVRRRAHGLGPGYGPGYGQARWVPAAQNDGTRSAEQTLAERFAKGDIDEVEYRARLEVLRANRANGS